MGLGDSSANIARSALDGIEVAGKVLVTTAVMIDAEMLWVIAWQLFERLELGFLLSHWS
jgi:hypothetical protein